MCVRDGKIPLNSNLILLIPNYLHGKKMRIITLNSNLILLIQVIFPKISLTVFSLNSNLILLIQTTRELPPMPTSFFKFQSDSINTAKTYTIVSGDTLL